MSLILENVELSILLKLASNFYLWKLQKFLTSNDKIYSNFSIKFLDFLKIIKSNDHQVMINLILFYIKYTVLFLLFLNYFKICLFFPIMVVKLTCEISCLLKKNLKK